MRNQPIQPAIIEKVIAALSYVTMGTVGFIWLLVALFTKNNLRPFLKYHIFQSIFISIAFFLIGQFYGLTMNILAHVPFLNIILIGIHTILTLPIVGIFSPVDIFVTALILYLTATSFLGQFTYIPWVSEIIKANVRNS